MCKYWNKIYLEDMINLKATRSLFFQYLYTFKKLEI